MFTDESSYTKCFYYKCIVNDLLYEKRKIKEMKVKKKTFLVMRQCVTITSDLKWNSHTRNVCTKANITLGFLRRNLFSCPQTSSTFFINDGV